jgi:hypothetical protein
VMLVVLMRTPSGWLNAHSQKMEERATLLDLQEMDLEVRKAILVVELEHGLHRCTRWLMTMPPKLRGYCGKSCRRSLSSSTWACCPLRTFLCSRRHLSESFRQSPSS